MQIYKNKFFFGYLVRPSGQIHYSGQRKSGQIKSHDTATSRPHNFVNKIDMRMRFSIMDRRVTEV